MSNSHPFNQDHESGMVFLRSLVPNLDERLRDVLPNNPDLEKLIIEFIYGRLHHRPHLQTVEREIIALAAITALGGCEAALAAHVELAIRSGLTEAQVLEVILHCSAYAGFPRAIAATRIATEVITQMKDR
jgi:4-carboxymuconolactone decarboxylase